jgi:hypothetical protein
MLFLLFRMLFVGRGSTPASATRQTPQSPVRGGINQLRHTKVVTRRSLLSKYNGDRGACPYATYPGASPCLHLTSTRDRLRDGTCAKNPGPGGVVEIPRESGQLSLSPSFPPSRPWPHPHE